MVCGHNIYKTNNHVMSRFINFLLVIFQCLLFFLMISIGRYNAQSLKGFHIWIAWDSTHFGGRGVENFQTDSNLVLVAFTLSYDTGPNCLKKCLSAAGMVVRSPERSTDRRGSREKTRPIGWAKLKPVPTV